MEFDRVQNSLPSGAGRFSFRIPALVIGLFATSNFTYAQDTVATTEAAAVGVADADPAKISLEEKYAALERVNNDLEEKILALEQSNKILEKSADQLKQTVLKTKAAGRRLSSNLARRVSRNVARHVAGMAGTAIPYIGAGVSVAMTALDVKDGCESVQELNEMNRMMNLEREDESHICAIQVPTREEVIAQVINNWRSAYGNAAAWANQYETMLSPEPPIVSYSNASVLWMAVFGPFPKTVLPAWPTLPASPVSPASPTPPVPPTLPTLPTIRRP